MSSIEGVLQGFLSERKEILLAYLFGSIVRRQRGAVHDIDIGILVDLGQIDALDKETPYGYRAYMICELEHLLRFTPVDLIILNHAPPLLLKTVVSTGKLIFSRSERDRVCFEVTSLKRYADTAHLRNIKRHYMSLRIRKGFSAYA